MKLCIKNMVSNRCIMVVKDELRKFRLHFVIHGLGEVEIMENISPEIREQLKVNLSYSGLELMDNKRTVLVEKIKSVIIEAICDLDEINKRTIATILSERLNYKYTYLANLFSEVVGVSVQHFTILEKVERIKQLLLYGELNITEIAHKLKYSSVGHLSNQFKKVTGLSPVHFKLLKDKRQMMIEEMELA